MFDLSSNHINERQVVNMIRTVRGAISELQKEDPDIPISEYSVRIWIKSGKLPAIKNGNRYLVNTETLKKFLMGEL